ncbi:unnamed protein product [Moneuplotes crassus]|uniref:Uncharacterized protein n=1 Tax=Euplotes crassus TaxID=5936 RepID=A0AAD1XWW2_EUPCR|nr:unnamed protein product [Moneuplotes crassus]
MVDIKWGTIVSRLQSLLSEGRYLASLANQAEALLSLIFAMVLPIIFLTSTTKLLLLFALG